MFRSRLTQKTIDRLASALDDNVQHGAHLHDVTRGVLHQQVAENAPRAWDVQGNPQVHGNDVRVVTTARGKGAKALVAEKLRGDTEDIDSVSGVDPDERSMREIGRGRNSAHTADAHTRTFPGGFSTSQSYSSVKVAEKAPSRPTDKDVLARLRGIRANNDALPRYREMILTEPLILDTPLDALPDVPFPPNEDALSELLAIRNTMDMEPLTDLIMDLADDEPLELFRRACDEIGVSVDTEILPLIVGDLRRYAMALKYIYRRPRPLEIAPYFDVTIIPTDVDMYEGSPSYPSIHSTIGYGVARYYGHMYPQHAERFQDVAETIALQRIQSGHHYPSDNEYARVIAHALLQDTSGSTTSAPTAAVPEQVTPQAPTAPAPQQTPAPEKTAGRGIRLRRS